MIVKQHYAKIYTVDRHATAGRKPAFRDEHGGISEPIVQNRFLLHLPRKESNPITVDIIQIHSNF